MTRLILSFLNFPILLFFSLMGIAIQGSLFYSYPLFYLQPDLLLLLVIWAALRREFFEGGVLTLLLGYFAEIHSSAPSGLFLSCYMIVFLMTRFSAKVFIIPDLTGMVGFAILGSILWKLTSLTILIYLDAVSGQWKHTVSLMLPSAVIEGIFSIWIFQWLDRFDWITFKHPKAKQSIEDELRLEGEGL